MNIPEPIQGKLTELDKIVREYPLKIPTQIVSKFLGIDYNCLIRALEQGKVPFGFGWNNGLYKNRGTYIPTAVFYFWYTGPLLKNEVV